MKNAIYVLNVHESPKFPRFMESRAGEHDGDVIFLTGSSKVAVLRIRNEQYAIWTLFEAESPKFPKICFA